MRKSLVAVCAAASTALVLTACGGGTSKQEAFCNEAKVLTSTPNAGTSPEEVKTFFTKLQASLTKMGETAPNAELEKQVKEVSAYYDQIGEALQTTNFDVQKLQTDPEAAKKLAELQQNAAGGMQAQQAVVKYIETDCKIGADNAGGDQKNTEAPAEQPAEQPAGDAVPE